RVALSYFGPNGTVYTPYPEIKFHVQGDTRLSLMSVTLDGQNITSALNFDGTYFYTRSPFALSPGQHRVQVLGRTRDGAEFNRIWTFYQGSQ
ncbi:MAG: hypothetical protein JO199_01870, partial [Candidatus Eremiobacteraeota bacterium]|nr:hypothetical protein [Candidatus Eremiobacteraeota bacterium]